MQILIEIFNAHGMTFSLAKTAILFELKGLDVQKVLKPYKVKNKTEVFMKFRQHGQEFRPKNNMTVLVPPFLIKGANPHP